MEEDYLMGIVSALQEVADTLKTIDINIEEMRTILEEAYPEE